MRMSVGEAKALHALKVIEYIDLTPPPAPVKVPPVAPTYTRRDMMAVKPAAKPAWIPLVTKAVKDDGEA